MSGAGLAAAPAVAAPNLDPEQCVSWDVPDLEEQELKGEDGISAEPENQADRRTLCAAVFGLVLSIPAMVGTWCWPILIGWFMQLAWYQIDKQLDQLSYALEALVTAVIVTNICQFAHWRGQANRKLKGAVLWCAAAVPLMMAYPLAVVFIYVGGVGYPGSKMWTGGSWWPNKPHGVALLLGKYLGMICLTVGVAKCTQLHRKIAAKWRLLRTRPKVMSSTSPAPAAAADTMQRQRS